MTPLSALWTNRVAAYEGETPLWCLYRTDPDTSSRQPWLFGEGDESLLDDERVALVGGANVLGQVLDPNALEPDERAQLAKLLDTPSYELMAKDRAVVGKLLAKVPRLFAPGVDLDYHDAGAALDVKARIDAELSRRGLHVRWAHSSGPGRPERLHGDLSPCLPGAESVDLLRAMLGWWRELVDSIGLVPRTKSHGECFWVLPDDPDGKLGSVDLSTLNRSANARGSLFRPLGGLSKDHTNRKTLCPGSPQHGSPISAEMVAAGWALYREQQKRISGYDPAKRQQRRPVARFKPLPNLPEGKRCRPLERLFVGAHKAGAGHDQRLAAMGVLVNSGLVTSHALIHAASRGGMRLQDARGAYWTTKQRIEAGQPVKGREAMPSLFGWAALLKFAWGYCRWNWKHGGTVSLDEVWRRLAPARPLKRDHAERLERALVALGDSTDEAKAAAVESVRKRVAGCWACRKRTATMTCKVCDKTVCEHPLRCNVQDVCMSCGTTSLRLLLDCWQETMPAELYVLTLTCKDEAERRSMVRFFRRAMEGSETYHTWKSPSLDTPGGWLLTFVGTADLFGIVAEHDFRGDDQPRHMARSFVAYAYLSRFVWALDAVEQGDMAVAAERMVSLYRGKTYISKRGARDKTFTFPSGEDVKAYRARLVERLSAERAERGEPPEDRCTEHPPEVVGSTYTIRDTVSGEVVMERVQFAPQLHDVVAYERRVSHYRDLAREGKRLFGLPLRL